MRNAYSTSAILGIALAAGTLSAHDSGIVSDHLTVGYYYGHNATFDAPADPAWEPTLLVDTHPWELGNVVYEMEEVSNLFLDGWTLTVPGFEALSVDEQEFGGHGFYSWMDAGYTHGNVAIALHIDHVDAGLQVLSPFTLDPLPATSFLGSDFHSHPVFYVDRSVGFEPGDRLTATFHLTDANGNLADSAPFTIQFTPFWCDADWNNDGMLDTQDFVAFLNSYAGGSLGADLTDDGILNTSDFVAFLNLWNSGC